MFAMCTIWIVAGILPVAVSEVSLSSARYSYEEQERVVLTCTIPDFNKIVLLLIHNISRAECFPSTGCFTKGTGYAYKINGTRKLIITIASFKSAQDAGDWQCAYDNIYGNILTLYRAVLVTNATITPTGINKEVIVLQREAKTLTCITDASRPAAWIQWYIGGRNVTNDARPQPPTSDGTSFISSSTLNYTGNESDHNRSVHCEAVNIEGKQNVISEKINIFIQVSVSVVNIKPDTNFTLVTGKERELTCVTDYSRPAAWIQWYVGDRNITKQSTSNITQNGTKFISSSRIMYTGDDDDHNKFIYCTAQNIDRIQKIKSSEIKAAILVPVSSLSIMPVGLDLIISIKTGNSKSYTCKTNPSRPQAWIQWYIGKRNVTNDAVPQKPQTNGTKFISSSILKYTGNEADHNISVFCEAINIEGEPAATSSKVNIYILLAITKVTIAPNGTENVVKIINREAQIFTCTTDVGRPPARIQWYIGGGNVTKDAVPQLPQPDGTKFISSSTLNYTGNEADHNMSVYCVAVNIEGEKNISSTKQQIDIQVLVTEVIIDNNENTIYAVSDQYTNFTCTAKLARPAAWIHWSIDHKNFSKDALEVVLASSSKYNTISHLRYKGTIFDHGKQLICTAGNIPGKNTTISNVTLSINSSTVADGRLQAYVGVLENEGFNLSIRLIAKPEPTIQWTFINSTGFYMQLDNTNVETIRLDTFHHVTMYSKLVAFDSDYGNYTVIATNGIGDSFTHTITVKATQKPRRPKRIFAECYTTSANVTWYSNFNGGSQQRFTVVLTDAFNYNITTDEIADKGEEELHHILAKKLRPDTTYKIYILARNTFDWVTSNEAINCTTYPVKNAMQRQNSFGAIVGGISGSVVALIVIFIVTSIVLRRRVNWKGNDRGHRRKTEDKITENKEDELKDNPLYVSSVSNVAYSEDIVYENSEDLPVGNSVICNNKAIDCRQKRNKDGLVYADLEFASDGSKSKFVIRGLHNKTTYTEIDLFKKVEPLPDSDEEDIKCNSNS